MAGQLDTYLAAAQSLERPIPAAPEPACLEASGHLSIPAGTEIIPARAFAQNAGLISLEIPSSVRSIGAEAFSGCAKLERVTFLPGSRLQTLHPRAFNANKSLREVELPAQVEVIGEYCFYYCPALARVSFGSCALRSIGEKAFARTAVEAVRVPASVETIGDCAFAHCDRLESVEFEPGSRLSEIGFAPFYGCPRLQQGIEIPAAAQEASQPDDDPLSPFHYCSSSEPRASISPQSRRKDVSPSPVTSKSGSAATAAQMVGAMAKGFAEDQGVSVGCVLDALRELLSQAWAEQLAADPLIDPLDWMMRHLVPMPASASGTEQASDNVLEALRCKPAAAKAQSVPKRAAKKTEATRAADRDHAETAKALLEADRAIKAATRQAEDMEAAATEATRKADAISKDEADAMSVIKKARGSDWRGQFSEEVRTASLSPTSRAMPRLSPRRDQSSPPRSPGLNLQAESPDAAVPRGTPAIARHPGHHATPGDDGSFVESASQRIQDTRRRAEAAAARGRSFLESASERIQEGEGGALEATESAIARKRLAKEAAATEGAEEVAASTEATDWRTEFAKDYANGEFELGGAVARRKAEAAAARSRIEAGQLAASKQSQLAAASQKAADDAEVRKTDAELVHSISQENEAALKMEAQIIALRQQISQLDREIKQAEAGGHKEEATALKQSRKAIETEIAYAAEVQREAMDFESGMFEYSDV